MATWRNYWLAFKRAARWWAKRGVTGIDVAAAYEKRRDRRDNPFPCTTKAGKKKIGRGKRQLRGITEATRYQETALALPDPERRVAALLPLLTAMSSGEVRHLRACDVDLDGNKLWVRGDEAAGRVDPDWDVKSAAREDAVELPEILRGDFEELVRGLRPMDYIFPGTVQFVQAGGVRPKVDRPHQRGWLRDLVHAVCKAAGVQVVPPHGLRGTHGTLRRVLLRESAAQIGEALRHADGGKTARGHYIAAPEERPVLKLVNGGNS